MSLTDQEREDVQQTILFASEAHLGQTRKCGNLPYIVHPMGVLSIIATDWEITNAVLWKAALCHDILEDCPDIGYDDLVKAIGSEAASVVQELTFIPDPLSGVENHVQKREYMKTFHEKSVAALVVKCADRASNTCDFLGTNPDYAVKYWKKATDLWDAMMSRGETIIETYGEDSFPKMKYTRTCLSRQLVR